MVTSPTWWNTIPSFVDDSGASLSTDEASGYGQVHRLRDHIDRECRYFDRHPTSCPSGVPTGDWPMAAAQHVPDLGDGYICSSGVHMQSRVPGGGKVHAGILVRAVVDSPLPPGFGGQSLLLIRAPNPPLPDQSSFPDRRRSAATRGKIII